MFYADRKKYLQYILCLIRFDVCLNYGLLPPGECQAGGGRDLASSVFCVRAGWAVASSARTVRPTTNNYPAHQPLIPVTTTIRGEADPTDLRHSNQPATDQPHYSKHKFYICGKLTRSVTEWELRSCLHRWTLDSTAAREENKRILLVLSDETGQSVLPREIGFVWRRNMRCGRPGVIIVSVWPGAGDCCRPRITIAASCLDHLPPELSRLMGDLLSTTNYW